MTWPRRHQSGSGSILTRSEPNAIKNGYRSIGCPKARPTGCVTPKRSAPTGSRCSPRSMHPPHRPSCARFGRSSLLRRVWIQQFAAPREPVRWRDNAELPPAAVLIQSPHDAEAHFGIKRETTWTGYKVHLTESCDADQPALITNVETTAATVTDNAAVGAFIDHLAARNLLPTHHIVDAGYMDAQGMVAAATDHAVDWSGRCSRIRIGRPARIAGMPLPISPSTGPTKWCAARKGTTAAIGGRTTITPATTWLRCAGVGRPAKAARCSAIARRNSGARAPSNSGRKPNTAPYKQRGTPNNTGLSGAVRAAGGHPGDALAVHPDERVTTGAVQGLARTHQQQLCIATARNVVRAVDWLSPPVERKPPSRHSRRYSPQRSPRIRQHYHVWESGIRFAAPARALSTVRFTFLHEEPVCLG